MMHAGVDAMRPLSRSLHTQTHATVCNLCDRRIDVESRRPVHASYIDSLAVTLWRMGTLAQNDRLWRRIDSMDARSFCHTCASLLQSVRRIVRTLPVDRPFVSDATEFALLRWLAICDTKLPRLAHGIEPHEIDLLCPLLCARAYRRSVGVCARLRIWLARLGHAESQTWLGDHVNSMLCGDDRRWRTLSAETRRDALDAALVCAPAEGREGFKVEMWMRTLQRWANTLWPWSDPSDRDHVDMCVVCMSEMPSRVLEPCGHLCLCASDCKTLLATPKYRERPRCPLCRTGIDAAWPIQSLDSALSFDEPAEVGKVDALQVDTSRSPIQPAPQYGGHAPIHATIDPVVASWSYSDSEHSEDLFGSLSSSDDDEDDDEDDEDTPRTLPEAAGGDRASGESTRLVEGPVRSLESPSPTWDPSAWDVVDDTAPSEEPFPLPPGTTSMAGYQSVMALPIDPVRRALPGGANQGRVQRGFGRDSLLAAGVRDRATLPFVPAPAASLESAPHSGRFPLQDVQLVASEAGVSLDRAMMALDSVQGDIVDAIMQLTM